MAVDLAERLQGENEGTPLGEFLGQLRNEIDRTGRS